MAPFAPNSFTLGPGASFTKQLKVQSHGIVRLQNRTICETSCGCKTSLQSYLRFVGVFSVVTCIHLVARLVSVATTGPAIT